MFAMASRLKTLRLIACILLYSYIEFVRAEEIEGITYNGALTGTRFTTRNGRNISAFLGIPYAKPPIGSLRFKNPEPPENWDDILVADSDGNQCPQIDDNGSVVGNEDCLYLNVYTPKIWTGVEDLVPVMVYIHGGDFVRGNGSSTLYGPKYLLDKDVVLVTVNYRLGVLGFLSTGDWYATGNFGLKDQVLALKWIQRNIAFFGGNPDRVTLFGQGAGGASASLHSLTEASRGLFHQLISQSGTALCFWAVNSIYTYTEYATKLGEYLNCPTANSEVLMKCLRKVDIQSLVDTNDIFKDKFPRFSTWGPTDEPDLKGAFMPFYPLERLQEETFTAYPSIIGHVRDEGLILSAQFYSSDKFYEKIEQNFEPFLEYVQKLFIIADPKRYIEVVKKFYFNGSESSDKETFTLQMTNYISDTVFLYWADALLRHLELSNNVYLYSFEYRGTFSQTSRQIGNNDNIGVTHADDLIYIFPMSAELFDEQQLDYSESDEQMIDTMLDLWTSFARSGIPSSKRFPEPLFWPPYEPVGTREYLQIGDNSHTALERHDWFNFNRTVFWDNIFFLEVYGNYLHAMTKN